VIGGEATGCTEATTEVFVEAALFDPIRTAATGRRLEIVSDARYRFERGIDPAFVGPGLEVATRLILELCGGEPSELVVAGAAPGDRRTPPAPRTGAPQPGRARARRGGHLLVHFRRRGRAVRRRQTRIAAGQPDQRRSRRDAAERAARARRGGAAQRRSRLS